MSVYDKYKDHKRVMFYETGDQHARLLVQLHFDEIKQGEFFRAIVDGYVNGAEEIFNFIRNYKIINKKSKKQIKKSDTERKKAEEIRDQFVLEGEEIEDIFDILEEEYI